MVGVARASGGGGLSGLSEPSGGFISFRSLWISELLSGDDFDSFSCPLGLLDERSVGSVGDACVYDGEADDCAVAMPV